MRKYILPWQVDLLMLIGSYIVWSIEAQSLQFGWFFIGVLMGSMGEMIMFLIKRKSVSDLIFTISILLIPAFFLFRSAFPDLLGIATGITFVDFMTDLVHQIIRKKVLSWEERTNRYIKQDN